MLTAALDRYRLAIDPNGLPDSHGSYVREAKLVEQFDLQNEGGTLCFVAAGLVSEPWPRLVVEQRYSPAGYGFSPGVLLAPDADTLFIGAGVRLLAYRLSEPVRLWEDTADLGFFSWERHGQVVLMLAELELAAWEPSGRKLWSFAVEPPWSHRVNGQVVTVDVMGNVTAFPLGVGPSAAS